MILLLSVHLTQQLDCGSELTVMPGVGFFLLLLVLPLYLFPGAQTPPHAFQPVDWSGLDLLFDFFRPSVQETAV